MLLVEALVLLVLVSTVSPLVITTADSRVLIVSYGTIIKQNWASGLVEISDSSSRASCFIFVCLYISILEQN